MPNLPNSSEWREAFSAILRSIIGNSYLTSAEVAQLCEVDRSAVGHWRNGRCMPNALNMQNLKASVINLRGGTDRDRSLYADAESWLAKLGYEADFRRIKAISPDVGHFAASVLDGCYHGARGSKSPFSASTSAVEPTGKIRMVVFDFDGTLTKPRRSGGQATTWEMLWMALGYDKKECQELHKKFTKGAIDHSQWCKLTEAKFVERGLTRTQVVEIGRSIELLGGVSETLQALERRGVPAFVVSGSILDVVNATLGDARAHIADVRANIFKYDDDGLLREIIGTKYDFRGKADYIREKADERHCSPRDVLFVGNSMNDRFAHESGARTLCINPRLTDISQTEIWNDCIQTCSDLTEILPFVFQEEM